jgi:hypothetical protein
LKGWEMEDDPTGMEPEDPPTIPYPDAVAAEILRNLDWGERVKIKVKEDNAALRQQLRHSCKYHKIAFVDPSARAKKSEVAT